MQKHISDWQGKRKIDSEGKLFGDSLKESIRDRIATVKLIASKAEELGVELTEDDKSEIALSADASILIRPPEFTVELFNNYSPKCNVIDSKKSAKLLI